MLSNGLPPLRHCLSEAAKQWHIFGDCVRKKKYKNTQLSLHNATQPI